MLKNKFSGLNSVNIIRFNLAVVASQICEILRKYELIAAQKVIQGHRSWCKWKAHMQLPIIVTTVTWTCLLRFRDIDAFSSKIACFPYSSPPFQYQRNLYSTPLKSRYNGLQFHS